MITDSCTQSNNSRLLYCTALYSKFCTKRSDALREKVSKPDIFCLLSEKLTDPKHLKTITFWTDKSLQSWY